MPSLREKRRRNEIETECSHGGGYNACRLDRFALPWPRLTSMDPDAQIAAASGRGGYCRGQGMTEPYYGWAVDAVEGLNWLVDLDDWAYTGTRENLRGRDPKVIDVVHVRWATSTAITALDLCGVELAVLYGALDFWTNRSPVLERVEAVVTKAGRELPKWASEWLEAVLSDPEYRTLKATRDPLIHRFLVRPALLWTTAPTGHQWRTEFDVPNPQGMESRPSARQLVLLAHEVADRHVRAFGGALEQNGTP